MVICDRCEKDGYIRYSGRIGVFGCTCDKRIELTAKHYYNLSICPERGYEEKIALITALIKSRRGETL